MFLDKTELNRRITVTTYYLERRNSYELEELSVRNYKRGSSQINFGELSRCASRRKNIPVIFFPSFPLLLALTTIESVTADINCLPLMRVNVNFLRNERTKNSFTKLPSFRGIGTETCVSVVFNPRQC